MFLREYRITRTIEMTDGSVLFHAQKGNLRYILKEHTDHGAADRNFTMTNTLRCDCILPFEEKFEENGKILLVQPYIEGEYLPDFIRKTSDLDEKLCLAEEVLNGLKWIHAKRILYNNLSLENLMKGADGTLYFFDFSIASEEGKPSPRNGADRFGNILYMAPERTGKLDAPVGFASDYYSFGILLYKLLTDRFPFESDNFSEITALHVAAKPCAPIRLTPSIHANLSRIVLKLLEKNSADRYASCEGIL